VDGTNQNRWLTWAGLCSYLMGDVTAVQAFGSDRQAYLTGFDNAVYSLSFASGALDSIQWSATVDVNSSWNIELWSEREVIGIRSSSLTVEQRDSSVTKLTISGPSGFVNEFEDFHRSMVHDIPPSVTIQDGLADFKTVLAAHQSIVEGKVVRPYRLTAGRYHGLASSSRLVAEPSDRATIEDSSKYE